MTVRSGVRRGRAGLLTAAALAGAGLLAAGPAAAADVTRVLPWDGADGLFVSVPGVVRYVPGPENRVTITGPREVVEHVAVHRGAILYQPLSWFRGLFWGWGGQQGEARIVVSIPRLSAATAGGGARLELGRLNQERLKLHASGAGRITAAGAIRELEVSVSGAGGVELEGVQADQIEARMSGAGWLKGSGEARTLRLRASGAAMAELGSLRLQDAAARLSGGGGATLAPRRSADIGVSGGAHVRLLSQPPRLQVRRSGGGSVIGPDGSL